MASAHLRWRPSQQYRMVVWSSWGCDDEVTDNTVDVLIRLVCRKVDEPVEEKLVRTVRGFEHSLKASA
jgi:DNA-binding response OmpR family regulator